MAKATVTGPTLIVLVGLPGSGKTTWTNEMIDRHGPGLVSRLSRDALRTMLHRGAFSPDAESQVVAIEQQAARILLSQPGADHTVVVDDTNLKPATLVMWRGLALNCSAYFQTLSFLDVPVNTCVERDARRSSPVGEDVIRQMDAGWVHAARRWLAEEPPTTTIGRF